MHMLYINYGLLSCNPELYSFIYVKCATISFKRTGTSHPVLQFRPSQTWNVVKFWMEANLSIY